MQVDVNQDLLNKSTANIEKTILRGFKKAIENGKMDEAAAQEKKNDIGVLSRFSAKTHFFTKICSE